MKSLQTGMSEPLQLDTRRMLCPLPVIRTQDAIKALQPGEQLTVIATDPGTMHDIPAWVRVHGHDLLLAEARGAEFVFEIVVV
jgi:tRNA 2-thiouridine synthesizing protein A